MQVTSLTGVSQVAAAAGYDLVIGSPAFAVVPRLTGTIPAVASQRLQAAGLVLGSMSLAVDNTCNNVGRVMSQRPAAGTAVSFGTAVSVTIGQRPSHPCP